MRAFDLDERLVGVAFLDVGVYVTTMRALKNLLIIGDAVKSVWFVAFQVRLLIASSFQTFANRVDLTCRKIHTNSLFWRRILTGAA